MKILVCYLLFFFSFSAEATSFVYGTVYIQTKLGQQLNTMSLFSSAAIEAHGANPNISKTNIFILEFPLTEPGTEVSINIPEDKLFFNGIRYEIVNISCLRTTTVHKKSTARLNIVVCKKGMRNEFERQLAKTLFKEQLKKSVNDSSSGKFVFQTASLILSNLYSTAEKASARVKTALDSSNYNSVLEILAPYCNKAFKYLEQEKDNDIKHPLLHNESVKNIKSYAYLCLLSLNTKKAFETTKKIYQLDSTNINVILEYAGILRYLEQYNLAKKTLKEAQVVSLTALERANLSSVLSNLYEILDNQDSSRFYCLQAITQLENLESDNPDIIEKIRDINYILALSFEFDSCIYYYQKHLSYSRQLLKKLRIKKTVELSDNKIEDSAQVYFFMAEVYSNMKLRDSVLWAYRNSSKYINSHEPKEVYDMMMKKIKLELYNENDAPPNPIIEKNQLENSLQLFSSRGNRYEKAKTLKELVKYYIYYRETEKAQKALNEALAIFKEIGQTDGMFRKLRIQIAEIYELKASDLYKRTNGDSLDASVAFYRKALEELTETKQSINETYSKEITEISSAILEWFNLGSMSKQLLFKKDIRLLANKISLNDVIKNSERIYAKNPEKYKCYTIAALLQLASIYSTNNSTYSEAKEAAKKAYKLMVDHKLIVNNILNQKGIDILGPVLGHPESLFGLLANMYWLKDSLSAAVETFEIAKTFDRTQAPIFDLPLSRLHYELNEFGKALVVSEKGYNACLNTHGLPMQFANHYLYTAARSANALNKLNESSKYFTLLLSHDLSNYNYAEGALCEGMNVSNTMELFTNAIKFVNEAKQTPDFILTPGVLIEKAWAHLCLNELQLAKETFEKITKEQLSKLKTDELDKYFALGAIIFIDKPEADLYETSASNKLYQKNQLQYGLYKSYLAYKTKNEKASKKFLSAVKKPIEKSKDEILRADYLKLSGLLRIQEKDIDKGKKELIQAYVIYSNNHLKYPYRYEELKKLIE